MKETLIDTDILSFYFKGDKQIILNFEKYLDNFYSINLSIISYYEIYSGLTFKGATRQLEIFENFIRENNILPLTEKSCQISGDIYSQLRQKGKIIGDIDLLIAGISIENELVLVTNNEKHFGQIQELDITNWKEG